MAKTERQLERERFEAAILEIAEASRKNAELHATHVEAAAKYQESSSALRALRTKLCELAEAYYSKFSRDTYKLIAIGDRKFVVHLGGSVGLENLIQEVFEDH